MKRLWLILVVLFFSFTLSLDARACGRQPARRATRAVVAGIQKRQPVRRLAKRVAKARPVRKVFGR